MQLTCFILCAELVGAIIACYILAILYEGLKTLREWLLYQDLKQSKQRTTASDKKEKESDRLPLVGKVPNK